MPTVRVQNESHSIAMLPIREQRSWIRMAESIVAVHRVSASHLSLGPFWLADTVQMVEQSEEQFSGLVLVEDRQRDALPGVLLWMCASLSKVKSACSVPRCGKLIPIHSSSGGCIS